MGVKKQRNWNCCFGVFNVNFGSFLTRRLKMWKKIAVSMVVMVCSIAYATPYIEIDGLAGAEHWT